MEDVERKIQCMFRHYADTEILNQFVIRSLRLKLIDAKQKNITAVSVLLLPPTNYSGQNNFNEVKKKSSRRSKSLFFPS